MVDHLVACGADLNAEDDVYKATPLGWANEKGYTQMTLTSERRESITISHRLKEIENDHPAIIALL
jgi:hypothetical protein